MVANFFINKDKLSYILIPVSAISFFIFSLFLSSFHHSFLSSNSLLFDFMFPHSSAGFLMGLNLALNICNAFIIKWLCLKHELTDKQNQLPAFIYLLISNTINVSGAFHPVILAATLLLLTLNKLFSIYREENSLSSIFDACFLLSLSFFVYSPFILFVIIPFISLLIMKPFKINEWIAAFFGLICPFFIASMVFYIINNEVFIYTISFQNLFSVNHPFIFEKALILDHFIIFIVMLLSLFYSYNRINQLKIKAQKSLHILMWLIAFGIIGMFIMKEKNLFFYTFFIVPISVFIGHYIGSMRRKWVAELLTLALLFGFVCSNLMISNLF
jgi:hypothetical protein